MTLAADVTQRDHHVEIGALAELSAKAASAAERLLGKALAATRADLAPDGKSDAAILDREQHRVHGLAWLATYVESIKQLAAYAERQGASGRFGEIEGLLVQIGLGEYCAQVAGGIAMSQLEFIRLGELGVSPEDQAAFVEETAVRALIAEGNTPKIRARLMALINESQGTATYGDTGLDETLETMRGEMRRFSEAEIAPHAHGWHLTNSYIPLEIIAKMSELGVFGLTIPEEFGGLGLGKEAMCLVSEELSRGYIGVGSLGTRSEIAAELILGRGHRGAEAEMAAAARIRRNPPHRRLHRTEHRLRPRLAEDPRRS